MAIIETKGTPPALEGYAPWYHRPKSEGDGGGVAITVRNDIKQNSQLVDDLENNNNQEIIWIQINLNRRNKIYAGVYYGKQENTPADEVEREMSQLRAQITKLRPKGHIILTRDFNAKININQEEAKQSASRNGLKLEETLEDLQLTAISTKSKTGTWTRVPWNKKETRAANPPTCLSVIHKHYFSNPQFFSVILTTFVALRPRMAGTIQCCITVITYIVKSKLVSCAMYCTFHLWIIKYQNESIPHTI